MKLKFCMLVLMSMMTLNIGAVNGNVNVKGRVVDSADKQPVAHATVQILQPKDSTMVVGNVTDMDGIFDIRVAKGSYILKVSFVGYKPKYRNINVSGEKKEQFVGFVALQSDAIMLDEAVVVGQAPEVRVAGDTLVYNSSAYRLPQGSALEELVKKLPGAEVDENGKITINGKEVKKIMVNGKEFFANDPKVAMKNLPVNIIDKIQAYDKASDMARMTGINDGEEETVLDLSLKPGMNKGWFGNVDVAGGTEDRYAANMMLNRFVENNQFTVLGSMNNVNDETYPGGGGYGRRGNNGLNAKKSAGFNFATERKKWETGGSVNFNYSDADLQAKSNSETFVSAMSSSYKNSLDRQRNKSNSLNADFRIEWKPNEKTTFILRPSLSYGDLNNTQMVNSFTFNKEAGYSVDELIEADANGILGTLVDDENIVNVIRKNNYNKGDNINVGTSLMANRKLGKEGRNITLNMKYFYNNDEKDQYYISETEFYQKSDEDKLDVLNRYTNTPVSGYNYSIKMAYSEPLFKGGYLQLTYDFRNKISETDNSIYDMVEGWDYTQGFHPGNGTLNKDLSKYAKYNYINHNIEAAFKFINKKHQLNVGVSIQPQHSKLNYEKGEYSVDTVRNVLDIAPIFDYRRMFSRTSQLRIFYRGYSSQPNMVDLLPVTDNTDPLNIRMGNPGLRPSFTNQVIFYYNKFQPKAQRSIMVHGMFRNTMNAISRKSLYDEETGGFTSRPENINGNWNMFGLVGFSTPLGNKKFTFNTFTTGSYNNMVAYINNSGTDLDNGKNKTKMLNLSERLRATYRDNWMEFSLLGSLRYSRSRNSYQQNNNMDTYQFSYGASTNINLPWNMTISTDLSQSSRRGYTDKAMNNDELVWNAQISQSFLKNNAATVSLQFYDILQNRSNISRSVSAAVRKDTEYNSIFSYCMVHFIYKLDIFKGNSRKPDSNMHYRGGYGRGGHGGGHGGYGRRIGF